MNKLREFITEIIVLSITCVAGLLALFFHNTTLVDAYLIWSLGLIVATSVFMLKKDLQSRFDERIEIYRLVEDIEDEELREKGYALIRECKHGLQKLQRGFYTGGVADVFAFAIWGMTKAKTSVQAIHLATNLERLHVWKDVPVAINYYETNLAAISRGVRLERIFIIDKVLIFDSRTGDVNDTKGLEIVSKQSNDGIEVTIVWKNDLPSGELLEDFIVFDGLVVNVEREGVTGWYEGVKVIRDPQDIRKYSTKFSVIKSYGHPLDKILESQRMIAAEKKVD